MPPPSSPPHPTASLPPPAAHSPSGGWPLPQPCPQSPLTRRHLSTEPQADPRKSQVLSPAFTDHRAELPSAPRPPPGPQSSTASSLVLGIQGSPYSVRGEGVHPKRSQKRSAPVLIRPETPPCRHRGGSLALLLPSFHWVPRMSPARLPATPLCTHCTVNLPSRVSHASGTHPSPRPLLSQASVSASPHPQHSTGYPRGAPGRAEDWG